MIIKGYRIIEKDITDENYNKILCTISSKKEADKICNLCEHLRISFFDYKSHQKEYTFEKIKLSDRIKDALQEVKMIIYITKRNRKTLKEIKKLEKGVAE